MMDSMATACGGAGMWIAAAIGFLLIVVLVLAGLALVKYLATPRRDGAGNPG